VIEEVRMDRGWFSTRIAAVSLIVLMGGWQVQATAPTSPGTDPEFSPLFERRLAVGLENMDKPPERVFVARQELLDREELATPLSGSPLSICIGSACLVSICLGSVCLNSRCLGSTCIVSGCGGSACVTSGCAGSACVTSACAGSVCVGSVCLGSACLRCSSPT
jgi:hypothetical protein